jgi:Sec-independent protein translocase protein TatA
MDNGTDIIRQLHGNIQRYLRRIVCFFVIFASTSLAAHGQDTQQQLQQLKEQLKATTKEFEQRISTLEQQLEKERVANQQKDTTPNRHKR